MSEKITAGATVWGAQHLPQNREVFMVSAGDGNLYLYKYHYPDQRKVKVRVQGAGAEEECEGGRHNVLHRRELLDVVPRAGSVSELTDGALRPRCLSFNSGIAMLIRYRTVRQD